MKLNVLRADPAGNITLFVLDPIERERRAALAAELAKAQYYKIRSGDTLGSIAIKYHTTVSKLCALNGITTRTTLRIGRSIRVR